MKTFGSLDWGTILRWIALAGAVAIVPVHAQTSGQEPKSAPRGAPSKAGPAASRPVDPRSAQAELEALIKAAKSEGELTFYSASVTAPIAATAFMKKYGIKTQYVRLASTQIQQRYASEAESGSIRADVMIDAGSAFAEEGIQKGWVEPIAQAGIPALRSGEYPSRFIKGPTAVVQVTPFYVPYNTSLVKKADLPKDWTDILQPKWKGQILISNPSASDTYVDFWGLIFDKYGEAFFTQLRPNLRVVGSGVQAAQSLGAGEGLLLVPATLPQIQQQMEKGAPVDYLKFDFTTGVEITVFLSAREKVKNPNAGRLFAHYVMSKEGNAEVFKSTIFDNEHLPGQYQSPKPGAAGRREQIVKLLGL